MGTEAIITMIITSGFKVAPRIIAFLSELREMHGTAPTQEQIDDVWSRHRTAYDRIMNEDPSTHPGGITS